MLLLVGLTPHGSYPGVRTAKVPAFRNRAFAPIPKKECSLASKIGPVDRVVPVTKKPDALVGSGCDSCRLAETNFGRLSHDSVGRDFRDLAAAEFGENQRVTMTGCNFLCISR